jgi:hypothetical protein
MDIDKEHEIKKLSEILEIPIDNLELQSDNVGETTGIATVYFNSQIVGSLRYYRYQLGLNSAFGYDPSTERRESFIWQPIYNFYRKEIDELVLQELSIKSDSKTEIVPSHFKTVRYKNVQKDLSGSFICSYTDGAWKLSKHVKANSRVQTR